MIINTHIIIKTNHKKIKINLSTFYISSIKNYDLQLFILNFDFVQGFHFLIELSKIN